VGYVFVARLVNLKAAKLLPSFNWSRKHVVAITLR